MNDDGKADLLCYTEWSVYAYYSHVAVEMAQRPTYSLGAPVLVSAPPDFDLDGDVDQEDFGFLHGRFGGNRHAPPAGL